VVPDASLGESSFPDGVLLVRLGEDDSTPTGPARAGAQIAAAIGCVVGAPEGGTGDRLAAVAGHLRSKRLLLVVDRLDHHLAGAGVLGALLQQVPGVKLMATSRVPLHLQGETVYELHGLPVPAGADDLEQSAAGQLFLEEAGRARPETALGPAEREAAAEVCRLLSGHPLALLLAASSLRGLTCADLAADLAAGRELPAAPLGDRPARQHSLRAILDSAWVPLTDAERATLRRLAVFRGPFSRAAAAAVAGAAPAALLGLVDAGLVNRVDGGRYALSALVHRYAADRLAEDPADAKAAEARHAGFYATAADGAASPPAAPAGEEPADQLEDVRAAWEWSAAHGRPDLLDRLRPSLVRLHDQQGAWAEAAHCLGAAATRLRASLTGDAAGGGDQAGGAVKLASVLAACLVDLAHCEIQRGRLAAAGTTLHEARGFAAAFRLPATEAWAALRAGQLLLHQGHRPAARLELEPALELGRELGIQRLQGEAAHALGALAAAGGDLERAAELGELALRCARGASDALAECRAELLLGETAARRGDFTSADASLASALALSDRLGAPTERVLARLSLGTVMGQEGARPDAAEYLLTEALEGARGLEPGHDLEARVLLATARLARAGDHLSKARTLAEQALGCSRDVPDGGGRCAEAEILGELGTLAHLDGDDRQALAFAEQALQAAAEVDCPPARAAAQSLQERIRDGGGPPLAGPAIPEGQSMLEAERLLAETGIAPSAGSRPAPADRQYVDYTIDRIGRSR
jgi:predicted ATPase